MPTINRKSIKFNGYEKAKTLEPTQAEPSHNHNRREKGHNKPYNNQRWRDTRNILLRNNPLCQVCKVKLAQIADHIKPVRLGGDMWDMDNLQALCSSCHNKKSARESKIK